jgi:septal ring factor EnvC (AmiA/AmiB activator)
MKITSSKQSRDPSKSSPVIPTSIFSLLLAVALFSSSCVFSADTKNAAQLQQELKALEDDISRFRSWLEETRSKRSEIEHSLEINEKEINEILNEIKTIQQDLRISEDDLTSLTHEQKDLLGLKQTQQSHITRQIRASFELGKQQYLKVVLNQQDPNQLARILTYYDYFNQARMAQIKSYERTLENLFMVESQIKDRSLLLTEQRAKLQIQQSSLVTTQSRKQQILKSLNIEIAETGDVIEKRIKDREHLEALLERITARIAKMPAPEDTRPFTDMKGNLLLPVAGRVSQKFGSQRNKGKLLWDGVFIQAEEGEPVQSIHYGRVVFSDWLRGFGLLLIINHGEGYLSLYGHNQVLSRETGDWVATGELIANVGNSGGQLQSGLYFEIRSAGKPSNPQLWCKARPQSKAA